MGRGKSGKTGSGTSLKPTNARDIENMNEAQLDKEIAKTQREIDRYDKIMDKNSLDTAENRALHEAFPLGVGGDGWSEQRKRAREKGLTRDLNRAVKYTEAADAKKTAETRLNSLNKAKNAVKGTNKTQKQIKEEKAKKAVESTPKTLEWKTTQKGGWSGSAYAPKIIKAGNMEIHGSDGLYSVFKDGKLLGRTDKLSKAKAYAERVNKK